MWISSAVSFSVIFVALIHVSSISGIQEIVDGRIYGGTPAKIGEFPYVVAIKVNEEFRCGGFIYNERWIVTAASCVDGVTTSSVTVEAGIVLLDLPEPSQQRVSVATIRVYDTYDNTTGLHDIALVQTVSPFSFNSNVNFAYYDELSIQTIYANITGWGATEGGGSFSYGLLSATVKEAESLPPEEECSVVYAETYNKAYMFCFGFGTRETSPCHFDEGSPLVQDGLAVGIMSRNNGCGTAEMFTWSPTIYTKLSAYYSWLITTAGPQPLPYMLTINSK